MHLYPVFNSDAFCYCEIFSDKKVTVPLSLKVPTCLSVYLFLSPNLQQYFCQGCPLSPLLFVLTVEMLALKIPQDHLCWGIELASGQTAKISQFVYDTTLILEDTTSLRNAMNFVRFYPLSRVRRLCLQGSLQLNKKKTKALWIGTSSKNKIEPLNVQCPKDPINFLELTFSMMRLPTNKENGNKAQYMAVAGGPDALWKNYACKISVCLS